MNVGLRKQVNIKRLNKGDAEAFAQVFDWYGDAIFRHLYYRVSNREIAQDLTSQTFLKVWEYVIRLNKGEDDIKPIKEIRAFLYRAANNLAIDYYRTKKHQALELTEAMDEVIPQKVDVRDEIAHRSDVEHLKIVITELKAIDQQLVLMRYIDELTIKEISEITELNENIVSVRLHRSLKKLHELNS